MNDFFRSSLHPRGTRNSFDHRGPGGVNGERPRGGPLAGGGDGLEGGPTGRRGSEEGAGSTPQQPEALQGLSELTLPQPGRYISPARDT